jgi:hypothetical protein
MTIKLIVHNAVNPSAARTRIDRKSRDDILARVGCTSGSFLADALALRLSTTSPATGCIGGVPNVQENYCSFRRDRNCLSMNTF